MADTVTPVLGLVKPEVNGAQTENVWGFDINANFDKIDASYKSFVNDAPADGVLYGRQSAAWAPAAPLNSPALTGNPTAPTPAPGDNDTSLATTAFVQTANAGKANLASPAFTGNPTAPTPAPGDNATSIATTAFVTAFGIAAGAVLPSNVAPGMDGTTTAGTSALYSRGDHVHPSDTSRVAKAGDTMTGQLTAPQFNLTAGGAIGNNSGANNWTVVSDASNNAALLLGGTVLNSNLYRNVEHYFQSRDGAIGFAKFTASGLQILPTTASTSSSTGALTVGGGIGVAGVSYFSSTLNVGAGLTVGGSLSMTVNQIINFAGYGYIYGNSNGLNSQANQYNFANMGATVGYMSLNASGMNIVPATASTSSSTGALTVGGGAGVAGAVNAGTYIRSLSGTFIAQGYNSDPNQGMVFLNANQTIYMHNTGQFISFNGLPLRVYQGGHVLSGKEWLLYGPNNTSQTRMFHDNTNAWFQSTGSLQFCGIGGASAASTFTGNVTVTGSISGASLGVSGALSANSLSVSTTISAGAFSTGGAVTAATGTFSGNVSCATLSAQNVLVGLGTDSPYVIFGSDPNFKIYLEGTDNTFRQSYASGYYEKYVRANGDLNWIANNQTRVAYVNSDGSFRIFNSGGAYKPGGGAWADTSDERIKNINGDYISGLPEILGLQPVRYTYKGNVTYTAPETNDEGEVMNAPHGRSAREATEYVGLIAQAAEVVMPELVSTMEGYIDGTQVADLRMLDPTAIIFALVNAVKTLNARLEAIEGAP
jgi:hypothetical protein